MHQHEKANANDQASRSTNPLESKPLAAIRVVELGQNIAGPYAGEILAMLGAQVVKVERPGTGDDARGWGPPSLTEWRQPLKR